MFSCRGSKHFIVKKSSALQKSTDDFFLVPETGVEPVRYHYRGILSPLRLPIPPFRQTWQCPAPAGARHFLEAPPGLEPGVKDLQSSALPLGYGAMTGISITYTAQKCKQKFIPQYALSYAGSAARSICAQSHSKISPNTSSRFCSCNISCLPPG